MFKKIEIWILYLTILLSILSAVGFGVLVRQELVGSIKAGWVSKTALNLAEIPVNLKKVLKGSSGDLYVEDRFPSLDGFNGTPNSEESYLLLSRYDGDLQEGVVELVDLTNFEVTHTWNPDIDLFNDMLKQKKEFQFLKRDRNNSRSSLVHPKLTKDMGLLFKHDSPLRKIDACSNLIFQVDHNKFHHSIELDSDDNIWLPSYIYPQSLPIKKVGRNNENGDLSFNDDGIVKLSESGEVLFEKSIAQIFISNGLEYLIFSVGDRNVFNSDPIHLNDIQPVNSDGKYWKKGDVFLSLRHQSMVLLYRPSTNKIIWKGTGPFFHQHDIDILDDHRISVFNNNSKDFYNGDFVDGNNQVIIYNFETDEYTEYLSKSLKKHDVRTITGGRSEILDNGDLFIEESYYSRILYFDSSGSLKWSYINRAKNEKTFDVTWSRILYTQEDIQTVNNFITNKRTCNE
jgi:hypothetical protein